MLAGGFLLLCRRFQKGRAVRQALQRLARAAPRTLVALEGFVDDMGSQYRSAIFWNSDEQRRTAERVKAEVDGSGKWDKKVVTEIVKAGPFYPAEEYHQDYLQKNPGGYTCHDLRD